MGILTRIFVVCLMASCHGIADCAVVQVVNKQELGSGSTTEATLPENTTFGLFRTVSTVTKIRQGPPLQLRVIQNTSIVTTPSAESSSLRPTRTGEDTSSPARSSTGTSHVHSPIMTTIPEDDLAPLYLEWPGDVDPEDLIPLYQDLANSDNGELVSRDNYDDGYGFGYGSSTTGPVNGGYGNPSGPTNLPSGGYGSHPTPTVEPTVEPTGLPTGGYGNPPPPEIVDPTFVTIPDPPPTATVSLEIWSSSFDPSTSTDGATVVVVEPAPSTESPVPNVTVTVDPPEATLPLPLPTVGPSLATTIVPAETVHSTPGYVYTTVTPSYTGPHAATSTFVIVHTPTAHSTPVPVGTSAGYRAQPNLRFSWAITILAVATVAVSYVVNGPKLTKAGREKQSKHCDH